MMARQRARLHVGYCSHPQAGPSDCSDQIIRAHTVQRSGGLSRIAENGHVVSVRAGAEAIFENEGRIIPRESGIRNATTFRGFCGHHDSTMFRPVEAGNRTLTLENSFLLAYRALAFEIYSKRAALECVPIQREMDAGTPFELQVLMQQHLYVYEQGLLRGLRDLESWRAAYDQAYLSGDYSAFSFYAVAFDRVLPVVSSGLFHPEFDFAGNRLQIISRGNAEFDHVAFNLTSLGDTSVAVLGWTATAADAARQFVESLRAVPDDRKANAVVLLAFEHLENTCMRPSWWSALSQEKLAFALEKFSSGTAGAAERNEYALAYQVEFVEASVTEILTVGV